MQKLMILLTACFFFTACDSSSNPRSNPRTGNSNPISTGNIVEVADSQGIFSNLLAAATAAGLADELQGDGPLTVFAPTDEAFAKLGTTLLENLLKEENKEILEKILLYHVVAGDIRSETAIDVALNEGSVTPLYNTDSIKLRLQGQDLFLNKSQVTAVDVLASNGVIHVIDAVLTPESLAADIARLSRPSITEIAVGAGSFNILVQALQATGLDSVLSSPGEYTVFAPTDEAFLALGNETIQDLLKPENLPTLKSILLFHVLGSEVLAETAIQLGRNLSMVEALNGSDLHLSFDENIEALFVNDSQVINTDIKASNGVIHIIDKVLIP